MLCTRCRREPRRAGQRWGKRCHAAHMRRTRPKHSELKPVARFKAVARSYANAYLKRGLLERQPCEVCGRKAEMHHDDYRKPLAVRWLCRVHHLLHHARRKARTNAARAAA